MMNRRSHRPVSFLSSLLLPVLAACGNGDGSGVAGPETSTPAQLAFITGPIDAVPGEPFPRAVVVAIQDSSGNTVPDAAGAVALDLGENPGGGRLSGTTTVEAVDGVARFDDLVVDRSGNGYRLSASAAGLSPATSDPFDVRLALVGLTAGEDHACGLTPGGVGYCWGQGNLGQRGDGEAGPDRDVPGRIAGSLTFRLVVAGGNHTCALTPAGAPYCWGWDTSGQRGDGQAGTRDTADTPVPVVGGLAFDAIAAGDDFNCALTTDGAAYCWGDNGSGELGAGQTGTDSGEPTLVLGGLQFEGVTAGLAHACGLTATGEVHCWGENGIGQLGDGNGGTDRDTPVAVVGGLTFSSVTAGWDHTCGLTPEGAAHCWGDDSQAQLGNGSGGTSDVPVPVQGDLTFRAIEAGGSHTCGLTASGAAHCWGRNDRGQLGDGNPGADRDVPVPVVDGLRFESLTAGERLTCGWTETGRAYCWGRNDHGQLGDANAGTSSGRPVPVVDPFE